MATRLKNVDEIVSANNKATRLDYSLHACTGTVDLSGGNNHVIDVDANGGVTLDFEDSKNTTPTDLTDKIGQSGNIWIHNNTQGCSINTARVKSAGSITASHWVSYLVTGAGEVVISVSGEVA